MTRNDYTAPEPRNLTDLLIEVLKRDTVKSLTLTQPFGTLVALAATQENAKHNETRSWGPDITGVPICIHTAKGYTSEDEDICDYEPIRAALEEGGYTQDFTKRGNVWGLPLGKVIAVAWLERVIRLPAYSTQKDYPAYPERAFGSYGPRRCIWQFSAIYALKSPIAARGARMVWDWHPTDAFWAEIQDALDQEKARPTAARTSHHKHVLETRVS